MFCIFDGHISKIVSEFLVNYLPYEIFNHSQYKKNYKNAIYDVFSKT